MIWIKSLTRDIFCKAVRLDAVRDSQSFRSELSLAFRLQRPSSSRLPQIGRDVRGSSRTIWDNACSPRLSRSDRMLGDTKLSTNFDTSAIPRDRGIWQLFSKPMLKICLLSPAE